MHLRFVSIIIEDVFTLESFTEISSPGISESLAQIFTAQFLGARGNYIAYNYVIKRQYLENQCCHLYVSVAKL